MAARAPLSRVMRGRVLWLSAILAVGVAGAACVPHPVGPARTFESYERKANTTAESALSGVETARMGAESAAKGNLFGPFVSVLLSEQEESVSGVQGTFGSIQPPNARADELRDELNGLLSDAVDHIATLRIAARRGELDRLGTLAEPLQHDAELLEAFTEAHS